MYDYCAVQSGGGTYARIKQAMAEGVDKGRLYMFDDASRRLLQELEQIQVGENYCVDERFHRSKRNVLVGNPQETQVSSLWVNTILQISLFKSK